MGCFRNSSAPPPEPNVNATSLSRTKRGREPGWPFGKDWLTWPFVSGRYWVRTSPAQTTPPDTDNQPTQGASRPKTSRQTYVRRGTPHIRHARHLDQRSAIEVGATGFEPYPPKRPHQTQTTTHPRPSRPKSWVKAHPAEQRRTSGTHGDRINARLSKWALLGSNQ